jgi:hypothetical protein
MKEKIRNICMADKAKLKFLFKKYRLQIVCFSLSYSYGLLMSVFAKNFGLGL